MARESSPCNERTAERAALAVAAGDADAGVAGADAVEAGLTVGAGDAGAGVGARI